MKRIKCFLISIFIFVGSILFINDVKAEVICRYKYEKDSEIYYMYFISNHYSDAFVEPTDKTDFLLTLNSDTQWGKTEILTKDLFENKNKCSKKNVYVKEYIETSEYGTGKKSALLSLNGDDSIAKWEFKDELKLKCEYYNEANVFDKLLLTKNMLGNFSIVSNYPKTDLDISNENLCPNTIYYHTSTISGNSCQSVWDLRSNSQDCNITKKFTLTKDSILFAKYDADDINNEISCAGIDLPIGTINLISIAITALQVAAPVILIVMGMIDFLKAVSSSREEEIKKNQNKFVKRLIMGVGVFLVILIVKLVVGFINTDSSNIALDCVDKILNGISINTNLTLPNNSSDESFIKCYSKCEEKWINDPKNFNFVSCYKVCDGQMTKPQTEEQSQCYLKCGELASKDPNFDTQECYNSCRNN